MDPANILWVEAQTDDEYWQSSNRRSHFDGDWIGHFYSVCEMFEGNENAWDDLRRRERLAEAEYE